MGKMLAKGSLTINELRIKYPFRNEQVVGSNPTSGSIDAMRERRLSGAVLAAAKA
jgi:hypothetical protein